MTIRYGTGDHYVGIADHGDGTVTFGPGVTLTLTQPLHFKLIEGALIAGVTIEPTANVEDNLHQLLLLTLDQWDWNHAEHCGATPSWPHDGTCSWPLPKLIAALPESEIRELLDEVDKGGIYDHLSG